MPTMAFVTRKGPTRWELRESFGTARGPRSRTLASFSRLTDDVLRHAGERAGEALDAAQVRAGARRAGAPVQLPPAEQAARTLAAELARGAELPPVLRAVLLSALQDSAEQFPVSDAARAAAAWADADPRERADTLHDLLLLADALPAPRRPLQPAFPRLHSAAPVG